MSDLFETNYEDGEEYEGDDVSYFEEDIEPDEEDDNDIEYDGDYE